MFNRGQRAELQEFLATYVPDRSVDEELGFREQTGGFDLNKIDTSTETKLIGIVKERGGSNFARFLFEVESAEAHRIANIGLQVFPRPGDAAAPERAGCDRSVKGRVRKGGFQRTLLWRGTGGAQRQSDLRSRVRISGSRAQHTEPSRYAILHRVHEQDIYRDGGAPTGAIGEDHA